MSSKFVQVIIGFYLLTSMAALVLPEEGLFSWTASTSAVMEEFPSQFEGITRIQTKEHMDAEGTSNPEMRMARKLFNEHNFEGARTKYETYLNDAKYSLDTCQAQYEYGLTLSQLLRYSKAIDRWKNLADRPACPQWIRAMFQAGYVEYGLGRFDDAIKTNKEIISRLPGTPEEQDAQYNLIQSYFNKGDLSNADQQYLTFQKAYPNDKRLERTCVTLRSALQLHLNPHDDKMLRSLVCP